MRGDRWSVTGSRVEGVGKDTENPTSLGNGQCSLVRGVWEEARVTFSSGQQRTFLHTKLHISPHAAGGGGDGRFSSQWRQVDNRQAAGA